MENMVVDTNFWKNKNVLITGHTGFKGSWLSIILNNLGSNVCGYALTPETKPNLYTLSSIDNYIDSYIGNLIDYKYLEEIIIKTQPEIIIHMAAQALVRKSYDNPIETFSTNVMGTINLLNISHSCKSLKALINVTSDKCYENNEDNKFYNENDRMGGHDPYSCSKGCSELITTSYRKSFYSLKNIGLASARAGNVIGGGDWSKDRLVPDILNACTLKKNPMIRNPHSTRPWQHVLEPLSGYLRLAEKLYNNPIKYSDGWNFGPDKQNNASVSSLCNMIMKVYGMNTQQDNQTGSHPHEAKLLMLSNDKAKEELQWFPKWTLDKTIEKTVNWHQYYTKGNNVLSLCEEQIDNYFSK